MKKDNQQKLDDFLRNAFQKNLEHAHPAEDFTEKVIAQLNDTQLSVAKYNKPVFSTKLKWIFGISIIGLLSITFYVAFTTQGASSYQLPPHVVNLLHYYSSFFTFGDDFLMIISAVSSGFWSLMLLDKIMQKLSFV